MDKHFLESGADRTPFVWWFAIRADGSLERLRIIAADVQPVAESHRLPYAGMFPQFLGEVVQVWSDDRPRRETRLGNHLRHRPMC